MVPKRTKVFICKVSFLCASLSRVLGIRTHCKTSYSRIAQRKNAILTKPCSRHTHPNVSLAGVGVDSYGRPSGQSGGISSRGQQGGPNFSGFIFTPILGHVSSVEGRQRLVEPKPYQPTAELA